MRVSLSPRQNQIMELISQGHTDKAIAAELGLSVHTVNNHVRVIYRRLNVHCRVSAVCRWVQSRRSHGATERAPSTGEALQQHPQAESRAAAIGADCRGYIGKPPEQESSRSRAKRT
ncbi:MAG TPA: helix-turn-helix transcriptional regulator [Verrucomicrobiota bacterium]|nr:helix-turn-helix transcriptional regulator [Verrucomicrobiota bacterium]